MAPAANPFEATWSERGHTLCLGHWELRYRGRPLALPGERCEEPMGTHGNFSFLYPDEPGFAEGLHEEAWILANIDWLTGLFVANGVPVDEAHFRWVYRAFNDQDWRCGSCGGCL